MAGELIHLPESPAAPAHWAFAEFLWQAAELCRLYELFIGPIDSAPVTAELREALRQAYELRGEQ